MIVPDVVHSVCETQEGLCCRVVENIYQTPNIAKHNPMTMIAACERNTCRQDRLKDLLQKENRVWAKQLKPVINIKVDLKQTMMLIDGVYKGGGWVPNGLCSSFLMFGFLQ